MAQRRGAVPEAVRRALYTVSRGLCYAPGCDQPVLVFEDEEPIFVGEIAHIVGAVDGGPRGRADATDRESFANLLVLCARHHRVIDNSRVQEKYSVEVLRAWKSDRESQFDEATRDQLSRLKLRITDFADALVEAAREATASLEEIIKRLETAGHLTEQTAHLLLMAISGQTRSGPSVGEGLAGIKEAFEDAYDSAGGATFLGQPSSDAFATAGGYVQHLRGAQCGHPAVVCALAGRRAVVVAREIWDAIADVGDSRTGGGLTGVGFPVASASGQDFYFGPSALEIRTEGGSWGPGRLVRSAESGWCWLPDLVFDSNFAREASSLSDSARLDLRLRLLARLPARTQSALTASDRRAISSAVQDEHSLDILTPLLGGRIRMPPGLTWAPSDNPFYPNDTSGVTYDCILPDHDGGIALRGRLQHQMPTITRSDAISIVDIEVNMDSFRGESGAPGHAEVARRVTPSELVQVFTEAWRLAFQVLPAGESDSARQLVGRPQVGLHIINDRPQNMGGERTFRMQDLVDFSAFGETRRNVMHSFDIAVLGRGPMARQDVIHVIRLALQQMADNAALHTST